MRTLRADRDIAAFEALVQHPEVHPAASCFHAQQAIEKCLKGVLFSRRVEFRRTHDLVELSDLLRRNGVQIPVSAEWLNSLTPFAVALRYEEMTPGGIDVTALAKVVRTACIWAGELVG